MLHERTAGALPKVGSRLMDFIALAQACAPLIAHQTLAAIVKTESGFRPLAIGVNGGQSLTRQPATVEEAVVTAKWLIANGYNIDLGLGQINSVNLPKIGLTVENAFEPCKNLAAVEKILHANFQVARGKIQGDQAALQAALSAYNTGSFSKGFANGYVQKVVSNAATAVPSVAAPAALPIPLTAVRAGSAPVKLSATSANRPVKLKAQAEPGTAPAPAPAPAPIINVYEASSQSVMVY